MKTLSLQIDRKCFQAILKGEQKIEHRNIYPSNADKYVVQEDKEDEDGEPITIVTPVPYEALCLINGRRKDSPRLTVKVEEAEFVVLTDEEGNDLTFEENGQEYYVCQVWYHLGEIISTENLNE